MNTSYSLAEVFEPARKAAESLFSQSSIRPECAIVLGSGIQIFEDLEDMQVIPFSAIEGFPQATVKGHKGELTLGKFEGRPIAIFRGRMHRYEGHPWRNVVFPITLMHELGVQHVILTNSAGGIHHYLTPGDLVLIRDHIYFQPISEEERSCLYQQGGARQQYSYRPETLEKTLAAAAETGVLLKHGTYTGLVGPTYETPAELRLFARMDADVVGMSTVPEARWAMCLKKNVVCISCVTNVTHNLQALAQTSHEEVVEVAQQASQKLEKLLKSLLKKL